MPGSSPFWITVQMDQTGLDLRPGATGTAAKYTKVSGARFIFRKLILRMQSWLSHVFVF
jgi:hypothetical protein